MRDYARALVTPWKLVSMAAGLWLAWVGLRMPVVLWLGLSAYLTAPLAVRWAWAGRWGAALGLLIAAVSLPFNGYYWLVGGYPGLLGHPIGIAPWSDFSTVGAVIEGGFVYALAGVFWSDDLGLSARLTWTLRGVLGATAAVVLVIL